MKKINLFRNIIIAITIIILPLFFIRSGIVKCLAEYLLCLCIVLGLIYSFILERYLKNKAQACEMNDEQTEGANKNNKNISFSDKDNTILIILRCCIIIGIIALIVLPIINSEAKNKYWLLTFAVEVILNSFLMSILYKKINELGYNKNDTVK